MGKMKLSFLDLIFGALGAVLLLFCILLSMSGAPLKEGVPANRIVVWEVTYPENIPADLTAEIFACVDSLDNLDEPKTLESVSEKAFNCVNPDEQPFKTEIGFVTVNRSEEVESNSNLKKNVITITLELTLEDEAWIDSLTLKMNSKQCESSKVSIMPSDSKNKVPQIEKKDIDKFNAENPNSSDLYFLCYAKLAESEDGGKLPEIEAYKLIKRK